LPVWVCLALCGLLIYLHVYSENHSLAAEIDRRTWLRWLDLLSHDTGANG
jgi:hypothetical protein